MKQRVLVLGGDGMAGSMVSAYLAEQGHDVRSTSRRRHVSAHYYLDAADAGPLESILAEYSPQFVVNCIGSLNEDAERNKTSAVILNAYFPHYVAELASSHSFKFVHISTDCVFSGESGGYKETCTPDSESFYGRSKALGEVGGESCLTLRTSIVGPDPSKSGIGLFNWFMVQQGEILGFTNAIWTGVTTLELAKAIERFFSMELSGLYHLVNGESIDKYELLKLFKEAMGKDITIKPNSDYVCDKSLINTRNDGDFATPSYQQMVTDMADWISSHRAMYPVFVKE